MTRGEVWWVSFESARGGEVRKRRPAFIVSSARYLFDTAHVGRDLLTRLIYGARVSLTVGLLG